MSVLDQDVQRELTSLGLREVEDLVDGTPNSVLEKAFKVDADKAAAALRAAGASVDVK
ncbi:hypothetical protein KPATCC21470_5993 [Kitasatospora purpeofusca]